MIAGSDLIENCKFGLLPTSSPNVTYSVYLNSESVTGLTYGTENNYTLYFDAEANTTLYEPIDVTITAIDATNHITIKDNMLLSAFPMNVTNNGNGFEATQLFTNLVEWDELDVSSPFIKDEIVVESYMTVRTVHSPNGGTGTTVVTLNYRDEIIYKIPLTYPIY